MSSCSAYASRRLLGDHVGPLATFFPVEIEVSVRPVRLATTILEAGAPAAYAMRLPSGDHAGSAAKEPKLRTVRPLALATTIFPPRAKATKRPPGDHEGASASPARRRTRREPSGRARQSPPPGPAEYVSNAVGVRAELVTAAPASDVA